MKTFNQLMELCPKYDSVYVLYNGKWHKVEINYLHTLSIRGELPKYTLIKFVVDCMQLEILTYSD